MTFDIPKLHLQPWDGPLASSEPHITNDRLEDTLPRKRCEALKASPSR
jgi:hypothetical protein